MSVTRELRTRRAHGRCVETPGMQPRRVWLGLEYYAIYRVFESESNNDRTPEGIHSRSGSSKHLMPPRLRAHTQRGGEKQREDHDEAYFQSALSGDEVQNRGRSHQKAYRREDKNEAHDNVNAAFAVKMEVIIVTHFVLLIGRKDHLEIQGSERSFVVLPKF